MDKLKEKIATMPDAPGVYSMKDKTGQVIYIGKAKSLKKRVQSYLGRGLSSKTVALMSNVYDIEYQLCQNESLALLLEASLVHKYKPKYNVSLRDDKSFPVVKITNEEFPAIYITRKRIADGSRYFGPYTNAKLLKVALKIIRRNFPYRSCKKLPQKACIYYRLKLSPAPCISKISKENYAKTIENICLILEGKTGALIKKLSQEMNLKSKEQKFEEAAKIRDQIEALSAMAQSSSRFSRKDESRTFLLRSVSCSRKVRDELEDLKNLLPLKKLPQRIEAFDISDISGKEATGSMVSFYKGLPDKNNYRRFRIKTVQTIDDYKMLAEVVKRRYSGSLKEELALPDLILIDGGKSHLSVANKELEKLGSKIPLVSIAKERENIYIKDRINPIRLDSDIPALNLLRRIRDEAHRFALAYHHILRRKKTLGK
ncbi:MAG: excinuclease ABC subunit C [Candidatus Omnitrophica bacterium CG23_combo_of_CG06-09_8_20_14_all_40_11]|nr:MAG: excinuclease ABC subunit C [Candidatus Omnitrophica bacterium CG23_combo_of_CG06-09_8_20_14_all_40_11]